MRQTVVIKGNRYGITVFLDPQTEFDVLLEDLGKKFRESAKFFKDAKMALSIEGKKLDNEQQRRIVEAISDNSQMEILCILSQDKEEEARFREAVERQRQKVKANVGRFYKGTLRSGQILESEGSVVILGDVNPGARVIALGNVIVLGALKGTAYAGIAGNESAFVGTDPASHRKSNGPQRRYKSQTEKTGKTENCILPRRRNLCGRTVPGYSS